MPAGSPLGNTESMFRLLFERSADAMSLFDPETGRFVESNAAVVRQVGAPNKEALGNVSPTEISPEYQPDGRLSAEKAAEVAGLALKNGSHRFEWMSRRYDGSELPLDIVMTAVPYNGRTFLFVVSRDISAQKNAEKEIRRLNAVLEQRVAERTVELVQANQQLKEEIQERVRQERLERRRGEQVQRHRDVLLELARSSKSNFDQALQTLCSRAAATLQVERVSYWSMVESDSAIRCELLYRRALGGADLSMRGARLAAKDSPCYFAALETKRPIAADDVFQHVATAALGDGYLRPLGISSMLDAPVWVRGEVVGVLCHEHTGPKRTWTAEEIDFASSLAAMVSLAIEESRRSESERLLRESEEKFRALFEGTSQPVLLHDETGILEANPSWFRHLGYSKIEEVIGKNPAELSAPIQPGGERAEILARKHLADALASGSTRFEWLARRGDGRDLPIEVFLTCISLGGRRVLQAVCNDITQRKLAESELLKTLAREKELGQLRTNFVAMVSHEFRTPLGIIQSSAEILDDYFDRLEASERKEQLQSIQKNTRRMSALMEEVLLIGGFYSGKMEFKPAVIDLADLSRRLVDEVISATGDRCPIKLKMTELPREAHVDERLVRHIWTNLLTNAVKYSQPDEPVEIEIGRDGSDALCIIRDHGIGIPEADREWLFTAFHRGQNVGERPGTGLGLVIVKHSVETHGGEIEFESTVGVGTTVTVRLPAFA
jgi:PAS domain S-box-containing protein